MARQDLVLALQEEGVQLLLRDPGLCRHSASLIKPSKVVQPSHKQKDAANEETGTDQRRQYDGQWESNGPIAKHGDIAPSYSECRRSLARWEGSMLAALYLRPGHLGSTGRAASARGFLLAWVLRRSLCRPRTLTSPFSCVALSSLMIDVIFEESAPSPAAVARYMLTNFLVVAPF